ncbi:transposase [Candidatus Daviesbacteria bacterium]|nr:transposase [Candidatus Daviesbacteria bacterium]
MPTNRKFVFANEQIIYHVFNRGVEKRPIFTKSREYSRALETLKFYRYGSLPLKFSKFLDLANDKKDELWKNLDDENVLVEIIAFCLMPNHFHFLLKQKKENGISKFISNFSNSYTKYFNTKNKRVGPLLQGLFKAVFVDSDEQFIHLSRYIHLNPVTSYLIKTEDLENYQWSSYFEYLVPKAEKITSSEEVLGFFKSINEYKKFVLDQVSYARELDKIKHLVLE